VKLHLEGGKTLDITAQNCSTENKYIQTMTLNGATYDKNYITYNDVMQGGSINFKMSEKPNMQRGTSKKDAPYSMSNK